jgi:two-component system, LytTR family, response regulator
MNMKKLSIVIVEDEARIRRSLINLLKLHCDNVEVVGEAEDITSGAVVIKAREPDVVLLDIQMPDGSGFELLNQLKPLAFKVIFVTAYDQHAVQAFKFSAIDYLLKPVVAEELIQALDRAAQQISAEQSNMKLEVFLSNIQELNAERKRILLNAHDKAQVICVKEIVSCQADGNYTTFNLADGKKLTVSRPLKEYDEMLSDYRFFRPHHSYLINLMHVDRIEKRDGGQVFMKDGSAIPVAARKSAELMAALSRI